MNAEIISKVTRKGQVTIPKQYRNLLGIKDGDLVSIQFNDNRIIISKIGIPEPGQPVGEKRFKEIITKVEEERKAWF